MPAPGATVRPAMKARAPKRSTSDRLAVSSETVAMGETREAIFCTVRRGRNPRIESCHSGFRTIAGAPYP